MGNDSADAPPQPPSLRPKVGVQRPGYPARAGTGDPPIASMLGANAQTHPSGTQATAAEETATAARWRWATASRARWSARREQPAEARDG